MQNIARTLREPEFIVISTALHGGSRHFLLQIPGGGYRIFTVQNGFFMLYKRIHSYTFFGPSRIINLYDNSLQISLPAPIKNTP